MRSVCAVLTWNWKARPFLLGEMKIRRFLNVEKYLWVKKQKMQWVFARMLNKNFCYEFFCSFVSVFIVIKKQSWTLVHRCENDGKVKCPRTHGASYESRKRDSGYLNNQAERPYFVANRVFHYKNHLRKKCVVAGNKFTENDITTDAVSQMRMKDKKMGLK